MQLILTEIRDAMVELFGISVDEAEGRIASVFGDWDLESEKTRLFLGHEWPESWARFVYSGYDAMVRNLPPSEIEPSPWQ